MSINYVDKNGIDRNPYLLRGRSKRVGEILGGQYLLMEVTGINKHNEALYTIKCIKCGHIYKDARISDINRKIKNNEGCRHGSDHTTYNRWNVPRIGAIYKNMVYRCYNPNAINYCTYGAKGITICDEWLNDPSSFERWSLENGYQDTYEINRKNVTKGYSPDNCEWVPPGYNSKFDRTDSVTFIVDGEKYTNVDIDTKFNFRKGYTSIYYKKFGYEETVKWIRDMINGKIEIPDPYWHTKFYTLDNCYCMSLTDWSRYLNIKYSALYYHFTHDSTYDFNIYLRNNILTNKGFINVYGYQLSLYQISNITGCNIDWLKNGYIKTGSDFLLDAMRYNGVTVVEDVIKK